MCTHMSIIYTKICLSSALLRFPTFHRAICNQTLIFALIINKPINHMKPAHFEKIANIIHIQYTYRCRRNCVKNNLNKKSFMPHVSWKITDLALPSKINDYLPKYATIREISHSEVAKLFQLNLSENFTPKNVILSQAQEKNIFFLFLFGVILHLKHRPYTFFLKKKGKACGCNFETSDCTWFCFLGRFMKYLFIVHMLENPADNMEENKTTVCLSTTNFVIDQL